MSTATDINSLFQAAQSSGALSAASMQALTIADIGAMIQAGLGTPVDDVTASEAVLVTMMPDDSGSIRFAGNAQVVRDGHNLVLDALQHSHQRDSILAHTRFLNGHVLFPYCPIMQTVRLDQHNYAPALGTPLYDQTVATLVRDMRQAETHIVAAMGIEDQWILTPGNDVSQIRRAFQVFSQSAVRASQSAAHFGQAVLGGFGAP